MRQNIHIENGSLGKIPFYIKKIGNVFAVITDSNLKKRGEELRAMIRAAGMACHLLILSSGEKSKSLAVVEKMAGMLLDLGLRRDACIIALGGGVVGDTVGFLASIYLRGIAFINIPTTLLAMADSSIGGKTGVNLSKAKNALGTFYNPRMVVMDPSILNDLPENAYRGGMAEIIKHAVIADRAFFQFLKKFCLFNLGC
jgi:3-dehydroquinate synthase